MTNPCVQDYIAGQGNIKGNVNVEDYYERDERFAIGAGEDGCRRFQGSRQGFPRCAKTIRKAFRSFERSFICSRAFKAQLPLLQNLTGGPQAARKRRANRPSSSFFDIYENSFR